MKLIDLFKKEENNEVMNLTEVYRQPGRPKVKLENLAEHHYFTALSTMQIIDYYKSYISKFEELNAIRCALIHDLPELFTNDIPSPTKSENPQLKNLLDNIEKDFMYNNFREFYLDYIFLIESEKDEDVVGLLVKLGDIASLLRYLARELDLGNKNIHIEEMYENTKERFLLYQNKLESKLKIGGEKNG